MIAVGISEVSRKFVMGYGFRETRISPLFFPDRFVSLVGLAIKENFGEPVPVFAGNLTGDFRARNPHRELCLDLFQ